MRSGEGAGDLGPGAAGRLLAGGERGHAGGQPQPGPASVQRGAGHRPLLRRVHLGRLAVQHVPQDPRRGVDELHHPLHAAARRAHPAHPHLHPQGPGSGPAPGPLPAPAAARPGHQVRGGRLGATQRHARVLHVKDPVC